MDIKEISCLKDKLEELQKDRKKLLSLDVREDNALISPFVQQNMTHMRAEDFLKFFGETPAEYTPIFLNSDSILSDSVVEANMRKTAIYCLAESAIKIGAIYVTDLRIITDSEYGTRGPDSAYGTGLVKKITQK